MKNPEEKIAKENFSMKEVIKINENTWRIEDDGVRFYLLSGSEKAALIDTGMNSPDARQIAEGLTNLPCS